MKDLRERLEKLRTDAEDCVLISKLATEKKKRDTFARLAEHLHRLANDVAAAIAEKDQIRPT